MFMPFRGRWHRPDFLRLWVGQAASMFGSLIGGFAYSMLAVISLHASPAQIAILNGCSLAPGLISGPWVGVWVDRLRRRHLLIAADLARALVLSSIPITAIFSTLTMLQLYAVATLISVLTMLFDVSFRAYVPALVGRDSLVEVNSVLYGTEAVAEAGGFAIGGLLVQLLTAPLTIAFDSVSFLVSAVSLRSIRHREVEPHSPERLVEGVVHGRDLLDGGRTIWHNPVLRTLALTAFGGELVRRSVGVVIILFFVRDLHLTPSVMGPIFGIGGLSSFLAALVAGRLVRRWGLGRVLISSQYVTNLGLLATVVAGGPLPLIIALMAFAQSTDGASTIYDVTASALLQTHAPDNLAGRIFAAYETLRSTAMVLGLLIAGALGQVVGLRVVLVLALAASMFVPLFLIFSPLRRMGGVQIEIPVSESLRAGS